MLYIIVIAIALIVLFVVFLFRYYFVGGLQAAPNSEILGTNTKSTNVFHQFLVNPATQRFKHDGMLLCFEKVKRKRLIVKNGKPGYYSVADQYATFGIDRSLECMRSKGLSCLAIRLVKSTLNDPKPLVLTHWVETSETNHTVRYNAYQNIKGTDYDLPKAMLDEYCAVAAHVKSKLQTGNYTHLVIACSGWNNYQDDSTELYENWIKFTKEAAIEEGRGNDFKPFLIGFTWASRWITPVISIFNKANDADELGITHVNALLWKYILPSLSNSNISIITIGHSFGARVISRAGHSRFMQKDIDKSTLIHKAIDFQGAYPNSRFRKKNGSNGRLYTVDIPVRKHFMTYSEFDNALKSAIWSAGYIGNNTSMPKLQNDSSAKNDFEFTSLDNAGRLNAYSGKKIKILVNANAIINAIESKAAGAHNDVQDKEAGQFIWEVLKVTT